MGLRTAFGASLATLGLLGDLPASDDGAARLLGDEDRISAVASRASWDGVRGAFGDLRSSHSDPGILMA